MLLDRYRSKIRSASEIRGLIGDRPRTRKVVMCHGVFDIVHPGHIHHLMYCKSKADILVASVTADQYIDKGVYRPHVPQDLRALNLAALDLVDYVTVNDAPTPHALLEQLQPDYYAKGFEYSPSATGRSPIGEVAVVESYGGEIIYTPGDTVYSSSALIAASPPNLRYEKLRLLLASAGVSLEQVSRALDNLGGSVHVVGDTIVDSLTHCTMIGGQTKTPTISVRYERREDFVGAAGVVAKHFAAAGARVLFSTVLGNDAFSVKVVDDLTEAGVEVDPIIDPTRPTTHKNAIEVASYRLLKIDTLDNRPISDKHLAQMLAAIAGNLHEVVVFSDFRHGIFNKRTIPTLTEAIPDGRMRVADSQVASRWGNITEFRGFDLITPNEREARFSLADQDSGVRPLATRLCQETDCGMLIMKMGAQGALTCHKGAFFVMDSFVDQLIDPVGAGDALLAYATLGMLSTGNPVISTLLGCLAAAVECEVDGNYPVTPNSVRSKIDQVAKHL